MKCLGSSGRVFFHNCLYFTGIALRQIERSQPTNQKFPDTGTRTYFHAYNVLIYKVGWRSASIAALACSPGLKLRPNTDIQQKYTWTDRQTTLRRPRCSFYPVPPSCLYRSSPSGSESCCRFCHFHRAIIYQVPVLFVVYVWMYEVEYVCKNCTGYCLPVFESERAWK